MTSLCGAGSSLACRFDALLAAHSFALDVAAFKGLSPTSLSLAPNCAVFIFSVLVLVVVLCLLAFYFDQLAAASSYELLCSDADFLLLRSCQLLQGNAFVLDRQLDGEELNRTDKRALLTVARKACLAYSPASRRSLVTGQEGRGSVSLLPLAALAAAAPPPQAALLAGGRQQVKASASEAVLRAARKSQFGFCGRLYFLRYFIARLFLLKLYFSHSLLEPFTVYKMKEGRLARLVGTLTSLLLSMWIGAALYSFKSGGVGIAIPSDYSLSEMLGSLCVSTLIAVLAQQVAMWLISRVLFALSRVFFSHRFPFLELEAARREAVERRLAILSAAELEAELEVARGRAVVFEEGALDESKRSLRQRRGDGGEAEVVEFEGKPALQGGEAGSPRAAVKAAARKDAGMEDLDVSPLLIINPPEGQLVATAASELLDGAPISSTPSSISSSRGFSESGVGEAGEERSALPQQEQRGAGLCCTRKPSGAAVLPLESQRDLSLSKRGAGSAALAAANAALERVNGRLQAIVSRENAALRSGGGGTCCARYPLLYYALGFSFFAFLFALFLWYALLFGIVQGDVVAGNFFKSWFSSQAANLFLITPALKLAEIVFTYAVAPFVECGKPQQQERSGSKLYAAKLAAAKDREKMLLRAAGLACDLPPQLAVLAYGLTLISSSVSTATVGKVAEVVDQSLKAEEELAMEEASSIAVLSEAQREALVVRRHVLEEVANAVAAVAREVSSEPLAPPAPPLGSPRVRFEEDLSEEALSSPEEPLSPLHGPSALPHRVNFDNPSEALRVLHELQEQREAEESVPHYMRHTALSLARANQPPGERRQH